MRKREHFYSTRHPTMAALLAFLVCLCCLTAARGATQQEVQILVQLKGSLGITNSTKGFESWTVVSRDTACSISGIRCDSNGSVSEIDLTDRGVEGAVDFASLCRLPALSKLALGSNNLAGELDPGLGACSGLLHLDLAFNNFSGAVPDLSGFGRLRFLNLSANAFTGPFPWNSLRNLTALEVLALGDNKFDKTNAFPEALRGLTKLSWLYLSASNIGGEIPSWIGELTELVNLELSDNFLHGAIPPEIGKLTKLWQLELYSNSLTGELPAAIGNLTELVFFDASSNNLEGDITAVKSLTKLVSLQLFENNFSGEVPPEIGYFRFLVNLSLYTNRLSGKLPPKLGSWAEFNFIDVSTNNFTGEIPPDMCRMGTMKKLLMLENKFTGEIPATYANCSTLVRFRVNNNSLSGNVPAGLWSLPNLNIIDLALNQFEGPIGTGIGEAKSLNELNLANNRFSGELPSEIGGATLLNKIDLSHNQFSGNIPESMGELKALGNLLLHNNAISDVIPDTIGSCISLSTMNLSMNNLSGPIPLSIVGLTRLSLLDLSYNQLSGGIPSNLASLKLSALDLSNNRLTGPVPAGLSISAYSESFVGNAGLCVDNDNKDALPSLRRCASRTGGSSSVLRTLLTFFFVAVALVLAYVGLYITVKRRRAEASGDGRHGLFDKNSSWDLKSFRILSFDDQEIIKSVKPENLIGKGGSGEVYRAELKNGEVVAVKLISTDSNAYMKDRSTTAMLRRHTRRSAGKEFEAEVDTLSAIRHVNVVKLYCCITNDEWSLLVYEYLPNGSLWERLHTVEGEKLGALTWEARYDVAVGAARGLEYLHHGWERPILHRDVKSSNILLDEDFKPRIADFGLAKILQSGAATAGKDYSSSPVVAGTHGYIAPEYAYTYKVNEKSDVYSFGVVLMELVTGRMPIEPEYGENKDIVYWISTKVTNKKESAMELVDKRIPEWAREEALRVLRVAVQCTAAWPASRPSMRTVVQMLEEAGGYRANPSGFAGGKAVESSGYGDAAEAKQNVKKSPPKGV